MSLQKQKMPFRNQPAPINYVAGLGRGAIGFTTRSDIGPARLTPEPATNFGTPPPGYVAGRGRGMGLAGPGGEPEVAAVKRKHDDDDDDDGEDYSEMNYDEFEGYGGGLWDPSVPYEKDDEEADAIWETVDKKLDSRRRSRREARLKKEIEKFRATRPKIQQQFADLKNGLSEISDAEWAAIPDIGDYSLRFKKRPERYTPAPDSLLERARMENEHVNSLDLRKLGGAASTGIETPSMAPVSQDLTQMGEARKTVLNLKLHQASDSVTGQTVVDPKGYLTDLKSIKINTDAEIGDIKRARLLLRSVTTTNPRHAPGWIAAARLEEVAGKLVAARKIISQGCQACPENEDVWLETARLHTAEAAPAIFARAVNHCPHSVKIWLAAAQRETDVKAKKRVLRRGLEFNPSSLRLWKAAVELEEPEDARILLSRAVECVPHSVELWLALAHLETYENARKVLNRARKTIPTDPAIWISAAKLEEAHGEGEEAVLVIIRRAVKSLASHQVLIDREQWLREAENCEKCGAIGTCTAIVRETIGLGLEGDTDKPGEEGSGSADDRKATWMEDAQSCLARGSVRTARAILAHAASVFPGKKSIWRQMAQLEKAHGTRESLQQILTVAVTHCPRAEILWLMSAKEQWLAGNVPAAREVLKRAFQFNQNSEQIWLAAVKLENDTDEVQRASALLANARRLCGTEGVWLKSALMERQLGNTENQKSILDQALALFPKSPKLWMMRGQLEEKLCTLERSDPMSVDKDLSSAQTEQDTEKDKERSKEIESVREIYQKGLVHCPNSVALWQCAARWEEKAMSTAKARALLEKARLKNPASPELWLWAVRVELRANNKKIAATLLAKALQDHPKAGILWAQAIAMEPKPRQKTKSVDALKRCDDDPYVLVAVARLFWEDRKVDKARTWFDRAVTLYGDQGDAWANFYKFEAQYGTPDNQQSVIKRCADADPHHGEMWTSVSKNPANHRLTIEQILVKVALLLDDSTALLGPPL